MIKVKVFRFEKKNPVFSISVYFFFFYNRTIMIISPKDKSYINYYDLSEMDSSTNCNI